MAEARIAETIAGTYIVALLIFNARGVAIVRE